MSSSPTPPPISRCCSVCKISESDASVKLLSCSRCRTPGLLYCGAACQKQDWARHKAACAAPSKDALALASSIVVPSSCPFVVRAIANRGLGLVASRALRQGEVLLEEAPLIVVPHAASPAATRDLVAALPAEQQATFFSLHAIAQGTGAAGREGSIVATNSMRLPGAQSGVFALASRLNHSCASNVHHVWNPHSQRMLIIARRDVAAGEELCTCYTDALGTRAERRARLESDYGFNCLCHVCALRGAELEASDALRRQIQEGEQAVLSALLSREWAATISRAQERLDLLSQLAQRENVYAPYTASRTCADALEAAQAQRDPAAIRHWVDQLRRYTLLAEGPDERNGTLKQCEDVIKTLEQQRGDQ